MFLSIPVSFLLFLLRGQIVRIFLGVGKFSWTDTRLTAACLGLFVIGIFAFCLIPFLARIFYSLHNTKTPLLISLITLPISVLFSFLFVWLLKFDNVFYRFFANILNLEDIENIAVIGLPLAVSLVAIFQAILLLLFLKRRITDFPLKEIVLSFKKILLASVLMSVIVYLTLFLISLNLNVLTVLGILIQAVIAMLVGVLSYWFFGYLLKIEELRYFHIKLRSILKKKKLSIPSADRVEEEIK